MANLPLFLASLLLLPLAAPTALAQSDEQPPGDCTAFLICSWTMTQGSRDCPAVVAGPGYVGYSRGFTNNWDGTYECHYSGIGQP